MSNELSNDELTVIRNWSSFNGRIIKFQYKSDLRKFQSIFGDEEGERLFGHFITRCNREYQPFTTFLVVDQHNALLIALMKDPFYN